MTVGLTAGGEDAEAEGEGDGDGDGVGDGEGVEGGLTWNCRVSTMLDACKSRQQTYGRLCRCSRSADWRPCQGNVAK